MQTHSAPKNGEADNHKIYAILGGADSKRAFGNDRWFSASSLVDIFEIRGSRGEMRRNLRDDEIRTQLKKDSRNTYELGKEPVQTRIIFIDEVKHDMDRLHVTSNLLQDIFTTYNISPRVASLLERQHMPGRVVQYDPTNQKPIHHQFWYSAVIRSREPVLCLDSSKSVLGWRRFCIWAGRDLSAGVTSILALRCPENMKHELVAAFANAGEMVKQYPMLLHAFFAQGALLLADKFSESWADPIYKWELEINYEKDSTSDFTERTRSFLTLSRQITQVTTDYDILLPTLRHLKSEHEWICAQSHPESHKYDSRSSKSNSALGDIWDVYISECQLLQTYSDLYKTRTKLGINECFAMVSQRDSEVNIQMATESTQIARASQKDGKSLRTIQILTTIFLPASLFSGIFGMGFFNTSLDDKGNTNFSISGNWWWYLALTIPMTTIILISMSGLQAYERWKVNLRRIKDSETSKEV